MDTGPPFIADVEPAKPMEPRQRAFDDPARAPEPAAVRGMPARELRLDPARVQIVPMRLRVVGPIALHHGRLAPWSAPAAAERRDAVHQGK